MHNSVHKKGEEMAKRKTARERFLEVAQRRTELVLEQLRLLSNCSDRATYRYEDDEVREMFEAIETELRITKARLRRRTTRKFAFSRKGERGSDEHPARSPGHMDF